MSIGSLTTSKRRAARRLPVIVIVIVIGLVGASCKIALGRRR